MQANIDESVISEKTMKANNGQNSSEDCMEANNIKDSDKKATMLKSGNQPLAGSTL